LPPGLDWRSPDLEAALARADELWFETPIDPGSLQAAAASLKARAVLPKGDSLFNHLSADEAARLRRVCEQLGAPADAFAPLQPWFVDMTLSLLQAQRAGAAADEGVEIRINAEAAPKAGRHAFETDAEQVAMLSDRPLADQTVALNATVKELMDDPDAYQRVIGEWLAGDVARLETDALGLIKQESPADFDRLITERNRRWADVLERRLRRRGRVVVVVGVGHLVGPGGVPALLRARGFVVDGPR
jgi:uncharacterized protein YbaP (TraB family)